MTWEIKVAHLSHSQRGSAISIEKVPAWVPLAEHAGESLTVGTGHLFCCRIPEWAFRWGWGYYDWEYDYWEHSLGNWMHQLGTWLITGFGSWKRAKNVASIPVTYEWVREHFPDAGWPFDGSGNSDDEMHSAPGDAGEVLL